MDTITARLRRDHPDVYPPNGGLTFSIVPLLEQAVVGDVRRPVVAARSEPVGVRPAHRVRERREPAAVARPSSSEGDGGAGRARSRAARRIVRQLLTESVLLATRGRCSWGRPGHRGARRAFSARPRQRPAPRRHCDRLERAAFTCGLCVLSGLLFGLAPAWRLGRDRARDTHLKDGARGSEGAGALWGRGQPLRRLLVVSELALAVVLLVAAGLLVRSFVRLQEVPPGFNPAGVLTFELTMTGRRYGDGKAVSGAYRELWPSGSTGCPGVIASGGVSRAAPQPDVRLGADHGRGTHATAGREVHQRRPAHGGRPLLPGDGHSAAARAFLRASRTRATSRGSSSSTSTWPRSSGRASSPRRQARAASATEALRTRRG